jgi:hypothetical protein
VFIIYRSLNARRGLTPRLFERDPLFRKRERGLFYILFFFTSLFSAEGEERGDERSDVGVSKRSALIALLP